MRNFEAFSRDRSRDCPGPQVTVLRSRMLSLNRRAYIALGSPDAVELLYDVGNRVIGLRPVQPRAANAYLVRHPSNAASGPFMITAIAYMKFYDMAPSESRRWDAFFEDQVLCVCLDDPSVPVTSNRARFRPTECA